MNYSRSASAFFLILFFSGCTGFLTSNENDNPSGAADIFGEETYFEKVNIFQLLNPLDNAVDYNGVDSSDPDNLRSYYLEYSLSKFYERTKVLTLEDRKIERNRAQFRIISASNQRCGDFKKALHKYRKRLTNHTLYIPRQ